MLNRCKKHRSKPVQLTIASIIIRHTHAPLQLCIVAPQIVMITISVIAIVMQFGATIQSCSGAWVWVIIILAIISCTGLFLCFCTCSAISSNLSLYFLHLFNSVPFNFGGNFFYMVKIHYFFYCPLTNFVSFIFNTVFSTHGMMVFVKQ